jgi:2,3-dihydroxybenzoate decarboxylase
MDHIIGRRKFVSKAASAALIPLAVNAGLKDGQTQSNKSTAAPSQAGALKIKRIAVEEHWTSRELAGSYGMAPTSWLSETRLPASPEKSKAMSDLGDIRLSDMDAMGIAMQVIAAGAVMGLPDISKAIDAAKKRNDDFAALIGKHPNRFAGFAALPLQDPNAAAEELERSVKQLGMKGTMINGLPNHEYLDADKYRVLWERSADLGVPIYIHPADPAPEYMKMGYVSKVLQKGIREE